MVHESLDNKMNRGFTIVLGMGLSVFATPIFFYSIKFHLQSPVGGDGQQQQIRWFCLGRSNSTNSGQTSKAFGPPDISGFQQAPDFFIHQACRQRWCWKLQLSKGWHLSTPLCKTDQTCILEPINIYFANTQNKMGDRIGDSQKS